MKGVLTFLMKVFLWLLVIGLCITGGCWACRASCSAMFPPPTAEAVARNQQMAGRLAKTQRGDFVIVRHWEEGSKEDRSIGVVKWHHRDWIGLANLYGNLASGLPEDVAPLVEDVICRDDPRWPEYRDRLLFGKPVTTQPKLNPGF